MRKAMALIVLLALVGCGNTKMEEKAVNTSAQSSAPQEEKQIEPVVKKEPKINVQEMVANILKGFITEHKLKRDDVKEAMLSGIGKENKQIYALFTNANVDGTPGVISFYDMSTGNLLQKLSNDVGYDTELLTVNNPVYKKAIAMKVGYRSVGIDLYGFDAGKLIKLGVINGDGLDITDVDDDGYEEFFTSEMISEKSPSMSEPLNNYYVYKWDGSKYTKKKRLVDKFASGFWGTTDSDAINMRLNFLSKDLDKSGQIIYYSEGNSSMYDFKVTSLTDDTLKIKYTIDQSNFKIDIEIKMTMIDENHMSFIRSDKQYILEKF